MPDSLPSHPVARWMAGALLAASFLLYSLMAAPVPALNEPHYLAKARHYWQPEWCAGDFFLESSNVHAVFFCTVGWFTTWLSLPVTALAGRAASLSLLAEGWSALAARLGLSRGATLLSAWLFLGLATCGNWSGEWLVGGVESKVFAYGLLLWGWSRLFAIDGGESVAGRGGWNWLLAALALGLATAFHPVAGLWGVLAAAGALVWLLMQRGTSWNRAAINGTIAGVIFAIAALPGLVPALRVVFEPVDAATRYAGTYIQVYYRLAHHLDPMTFPGRAHLGYALLAGVWLAGWRWGPRGGGWSLLHRLTALALLFALGGLAAGWGPRPASDMPGFEWRMHLLKFYPFRLADALLPAVVAFQLGDWLTRGSRTRRWTPLLAAVLIAATLFGAHRSAQTHRYARAHHPDWQAACRWIREQSPPGISVIAPHGQWTFKWYGDRAEFVNFKDCPQDVRGIVEWNRRQRVLTQWYHECYEDDARYSSAELRRLRTLTGADYLIADTLGPIDAQPVYQNATHRVYDLNRE